ncbi:MAG: GHKL domain-containing protein, partial [Planctomycetaceae bacterium]|nr:GHKL domain-containing protein [Planctomycetaceae bacterium]
MPSNSLNNRPALPWWRIRVLAPTIFVVALWAVMSLGTTAYLRWAEESYNRLIAIDVGVIGDIHRLDAVAWKMASMPGAESGSSAIEQSELTSEMAELQSLVDRLERQAQTDPERSAIQHLKKQLPELLTDLGDPARSTSVRRNAAMRLVAESGNIRLLNRAYIDLSLSYLARTQSWVLFLRMTLLTVGPLLGLYLGWRLAGRLQSSVTRIAAALGGQGPVVKSFPETKVVVSDSFDELHRLAEGVSERLRVAGEELRLARREVVQAERLAAIGELAAGVAHELRNPLTSVKLLLQYATRGNGDSRIDTTELQLILNEVRRMESTIEGLLDFARKPELQRLRHNLVETIQRSLNLIEGRRIESRIQIDYDTPGVPIMISGDAEQLNQVFVNLLQNAIEAMPDGGILRLEIRPDSLLNSVRIAVADNGNGISESIQHRLFEPFATTKARGTGLGLAISRRIIQQHGGTIRAENLPGSGALFVVELPLAG